MQLTIKKYTPISAFVFLVIASNLILGDMNINLMSFAIEYRKLIFILSGFLLYLFFLNGEEVKRITYVIFILALFVLVFFIDMSNLRSLVIGASFVLNVAAALIFSICLRRDLDNNIKYAIWLTFFLLSINLIISIIVHTAHYLNIVQPLDSIFSLHGRPFVINGLIYRFSFLYKESSNFSLLIIALLPYGWAYILSLYQSKLVTWALLTLILSLSFFAIGSIALLISIFLISFVYLIIDYINRNRSFGASFSTMLLITAIAIALPFGIAKSNNLISIYDKLNTVIAFYDLQSTQDKSTVKTTDSYEESSKPVLSDGVSDGVSVAELQGKYPGISLVIISHISSTIKWLENEDLQKIFFGEGIGLYENMYSKYIDKWAQNEWNGIGLSRNDGASLLLRLFVETGVLGLSIFFIFWAIFIIMLFRTPHVGFKSSAITFSLVIPFVMFLRFPFYDEPIVWLTFALVLSQILNTKKIRLKIL